MPENPRGSRVAREGRDGDVARLVSREHLQTSFPGVYAAGDIALSPAVAQSCDLHARNATPRHRKGWQDARRGHGIPGSGESAGGARNGSGDARREAVLMADTTVFTTSAGSAASCSRRHDGWTVAGPGSETRAA